MRNNQPALRIFVCMNTRMDGRPSCGARGASEIIPALRTELEGRGLSARHIDVRPCECLDRCEKGPVLLGFTGEVAEESAPPSKLHEGLLCQAKLFFDHVSVDQISAIVDKLVGLNS